MPEIEYSNSKAIYHTERIKLLQEKKPIIPTEIQVDLEAYCNDNCKFCSYRKDDGYNNEMLKLINGKPSKDNKPIGQPNTDSRIPDDIVLDIPRQMVEAGIPAIEITGGGESFLHPKITEFIRLLGEAGRDIGIVTNGSLFNDERIDLIKKYATWIRISMDSSNGTTHKLIHGTPNTDFDRRLNWIKKLVDNKREDLIVGISFIITPENYDDVENSARLYASINVNHIRFSWMFDKEGHAGLSQKQIDDVIILIKSLQEELDTEKFKIFNEANRIQLYTAKNDFKTCHFQRFVMAIGADSGCYPCCIMKYNKEYQYGNLKNNTLKEIVESMNTHEFMTNLNPERCYPCWLSDRNKSIDKAVTKPTHYNFI